MMPSLRGGAFALIMHSFVLGVVNCAAFSTVTASGALTSMKNLMAIPWERGLNPVSGLQFAPW
jgi:hypothetical protein